MATMNVSLPEPMKRWVEAQAEDGRYSNSSDYVRDLIRRDQVRREKIAAMQKLVDEARAEPAVEMTWEEIMSDVRARAGDTQRDAA